MRVDAFDYDLPHRFIAQRPARPRDAARLLEVGGPAGELVDRHVRELPELVAEGDMLVFNDTKVIPARLSGRSGHAEIEITLVRSLAPDTWLALAKPARKLRAGERIDFGRGFCADVLRKGDGGEVFVTFNRAGTALMAALDALGTMPLPPYIKRTGGGDAGDRRDYQTMFAMHPGAVAAPTAALHFTPRLMAALHDKGVLSAYLTLHVGPGTFLPVRTETVEKHVMHPETGMIDEETADAVNRTRLQGGRIVAVGSTSLRLLETAADEYGLIRPFAGETALFITPGYRFKCADLLLTNFHLPRSTLFMLAAAFAGLERIKRAYEHAKSTGYRFYSYGDACLLHRADRQRPGAKAGLGTGGAA